MDTAALAALVSKMQDRVQVVADALKKVATENLSPDSTPAAVELNMTLLQVETIAVDLEQLGFEVEDAMSGGGVPNHIGHADNTSVAAEEEVSGSKDIEDDDVVPVDWSPDDLL